MQKCANHQAKEHINRTERTRGQVA